MCALACAWGCGAARQPRAQPGAPLTRAAPAFGLTEDNAQLLWHRQAGAGGMGQAAGDPLPSSAADAVAQERFALARQELTALHPNYIRLLIDWAALQPDPHRPPALEAQRSGCARAVGPCAPYAGVRDELAAIASQQRAAPASDEFQLVIVIFGTPAWAADRAESCEQGGRGTFSRPLSAAGLDAYRALIRSLIMLGKSEGVALDWWSPWNEPNDAAFLSPQRSSCRPGSPAGTTRSAAVYAELVRAMSAELRGAGGERHMLLGELNAFASDAADRTSISQFVAALPADVLCLADAWSIHAYASRGGFAPAADPVGVLESALAARGGCAREAPIWITEAGAGAPHPGEPRPAGAADEAAGCLTLAGQLLRWYRDPRVAAVFQYSFREDPAFPVGLLAPELARAYPSYGLWLALARARVAHKPPPAPGAASAP